MVRATGDSITSMTGEVFMVKRYTVKANGFSGAPVGGYVQFENGDRGIIREVIDGNATILNCDSETTAIGTHVTLKSPVISVGVGAELLGKVVDPFGVEYMTGTRIVTGQTRPLFAKAPGIAEREMLNEPLHTGVTIVDSMFPIVKGQRIAVLGDSKSGKSSFLHQLAAFQAHSDTVLVFVLIGKKQADVEALSAYLESIGAMQQSVIVASNVLDSLAQSYIAPYAGCAIAEYFWMTGRDTVIMYDDLSAHAKVYREISLISNPNPGRDSYPGDMFYMHSSLLERAGKLRANGKTLSALPVLLTPNDDITAYLPTSIMSITDGQLIFDLATFRRNIRPALNIGLSVSRVGGRGQTAEQKKLTKHAFKLLAEYRKAEEFSHFGSETSAEMKTLLQQGSDLLSVFKQRPRELYDSKQQQVLLTAVLESNGAADVADLKASMIRDPDGRGVSTKSSVQEG